MVSEGGQTRGGYPVDAFARLAAVQSGNYWFASRTALIVWALQRYFPEARSFLDVGCGTGFVLAGLHRAFPHVRLAGTDFLEEGLAFARRLVPSATFHRADAQDLAIPDTVDVAGAFDVLEHIEDDTGVLRRMHRLIRPGGGLLIAVPQHRWLWSSADDQAEHVRRYTRRELEDRIRGAGFQVLRTTSFVSLLLPLMALSRWRDARKTRGPEASELVVSPPVNALLTGVLSLERALIKAGVSFPAGGSLLVIARRNP
jgi:SAM-dependent methyltransferase